MSTKPEEKIMACDFGVRHYREVLETALRNDFRFIQYEELDSLKPGQKACILRHDVDYIPEWAIRIAQIEKDLGIRATYFFEICAQPYNLREIHNYNVVHEIKRLGHTIGLHFDLSWKDDVKLEEIPDFCRQEKKIFEAITGIAPCEMISFHNPHRFVDKILNQDIPGMRHSYEKKYFSDIKYLSDSQGWYEGCMCKIFAAGKYPLIQLLTHEYIWQEPTAGDFISDIAQLVKLRTDEITRYFLTYHPVCKKNEALLRQKVTEAHQGP